MSLRVRLRYSTIMNYISLIYRIVVALGFAIIVARRLTIYEFGLWGIILSLTGMLAAPLRLWGFWAQRFHARGWGEAAGTGLAITLAYLVPASAAYILVSLVESSVIGWGLNYLIVALPIILLQLPATYLSSIVAVTKPELGAYANMLNDTLRLATAYLFVVVLSMRLEGAIYSLELAALAAAVYLALSLIRLGALKPVFSRKLAKEWFKAFYVPSLILLVGMLRSSIRAAVSLIAGSELPVAYLNVGFSAERPMLQASRAAVPALYARSLRRKRGRDVEETLRLYLFFTGFLFATFTVLSKTIASLYNPRYAAAYLVIPLVALYALLSGFSNIYATALSGAEDVDASGIPVHRSLLASMLFKVPLARLAAIAISYAVFTAAVMFYVKDPVSVALIVAASLALGSSVLLAYLWAEAKTLVPHKFPLREAAATAAAALLAAAYYVASGASSIQVTSFWRQAPPLLLHLMAGVAIYVVVAYAASPWVRRLVRDSLAYILGRR